MSGQQGRRLHQDVVSGGALLALAVGYGSVALTIPPGEGEPGPAFLPVALGLALAVLSLAIVRNGLRASDPPNADRPAYRAWLATLATLAYAALFQPMGFVLSTLAYSTAVTLLFSRDRGHLLLVPPVVTLLIYVFFRVALGVRLPAGPF